MDQIQNQLGDSLSNNLHEFWAKPVLNQWQTFKPYMDLRVELESIDMWILLMQMPSTYTGKYLIYPYSISHCSL